MMVVAQGRKCENEGIGSSLDALERELSAMKAVMEVIGQAHPADETLKQILRIVCELHGANDGAIGLTTIDGKGIEIRATYNLPEDEIGSVYQVGEGLAGQVLATQRALRYDRYGDVPGSRLSDLSDNPVMAVPVMWRGDLVGFFGLGKRGPEPFTAEDTRRLADFAVYAAIAIVEARSRQDLRSLVTELNRLYRLGQSLAGASSISEAAGSFLLHIAANQDYACTIVLADGEYTNAVKVVGQWSAEDGLSLDEFLVPSKPGPIDAELDSGGIVMIANVFEDPRCGEEIREVQRESGRAALVLFPLEGMGKRAGSVVLSAKEPRTWNRSELELYETAVVMLGSSIMAQQIATERTASERQLAQVQVRQGLARELHDSVCQTLFAISLLAQSVKTGVAEPTSVDRLVGLSREALADMRHLVKELVPPAAPGVVSEFGFARLRRDGLQGAIEDHLETIRATGRNVDFEVIGEVPVPLRHDWPIYCAFREAFGNALRHANSQSLGVKLHVIGSAVRLIVEDDGAGFTTQDFAGRTTGLGLRSMQDRMSAVGGSCLIESVMGQGTRVTLEVPI